jgi:hypothetical protein
MFKKEPPEPRYASKTELADCVLYLRSISGRRGEIIQLHLDALERDHVKLGAIVINNELHLPIQNKYKQIDMIPITSMATAKSGLLKVVPLGTDGDKEKPELDTLNHEGVGDTPDTPDTPDLQPVPRKRGRPRKTTPDEDKPQVINEKEPGPSQVSE